MNEPDIKEIFIYSQSAKALPDTEEHISSFIKKLLEERYQKQNFMLNFVFLNKHDITELNRQFLNHDYPTDVLAFDFAEEFCVFGGDIFICPEVVCENAVDYGCEPVTELLRVMCHGVLHLLGFSDKTENEQLNMRSEEEVCIELFKNTQKL
jgi:probable rRNA maturation factor